MMYYDGDDDIDDDDDESLIWIVYIFDKLIDIILSLSLLLRQSVLSGCGFSLTKAKLLSALVTLVTNYAVGLLFIF